MKQKMLRAAIPLSVRLARHDKEAPAHCTRCGLLQSVGLCEACDPDMPPGASHDFDPSIGRELMDKTNTALIMHDLYGMCYSHSRDVLAYSADCMVPSDAGLAISMERVKAWNAAARRVGR